MAKEPVTWMSKVPEPVQVCVLAAISILGVAFGDVTDRSATAL